MFATPSAVRRPLRASFLAAATATFLTLCPIGPLAAFGPSAAAVPAHHAEDDKPAPKPPADMSTIGGKKLGEPGTQVDPRPGADAPELPEKLTGRSWIVSDAESGKVLAAHNAHWKLAPASTLKMLFADTVLPKLPKEREHLVKRSDLEGMGEGSSLVGVKEGLTYSVEDLWRGVFLRSGNDAVHVLAAMNGGVDKTVQEMNAHAKQLRALDTHVVSPDGYDREGQVSSAYDLSLFARSGLQKKDFRDYASTARAKFPGEVKKGEKGEKGENGDARADEKNGDKDEQKREYYEIQNTNRLLTGDYGLDPYPGIAGVKNGYTSDAGNTFTGVAERDGRVLLVTVMHPKGGGGSLNIYKETAKLFDWGFKAADAVRPVGQLVPPGQGSPQGGPGEAGGSGKNAEDGGKTEGQGDDAALTGASGGDAGGMGMALAVTAGVLAVLALGGFAVHRRWPLPELRGRQPATGALGGTGTGTRTGTGAGTGTRTGAGAGSAAAGAVTAADRPGDSAADRDAAPASSEETPATSPGPKKQDPKPQDPKTRGLKKQDPKTPGSGPDSPAGPSQDSPRPD